MNNTESSSRPYSITADQDSVGIISEDELINKTPNIPIKEVLWVSKQDSDVVIIEDEPLVTIILSESEEEVEPISPPEKELRIIIKRLTQSDISRYDYLVEKDDPVFRDFRITLSHDENY